MSTPERQDSSLIQNYGIPEVDEKIIIYLTRLI